MDRNAGVIQPLPDYRAVESAVLQAVAYADVFDYPLTAEEVHRYLVRVPVPPAAVYAVLRDGRLVPQRLVQHQGYFTLPGRQDLVETRRRRAEVAASLWPRAVSYGQAMAGLPFVRMVAVTGALAMDNVESDADLDYLVVTEPGRLWLCRALVIVLVRLAARRGDVICPNYFLSERALVLRERNLFTAHELTQMVPIAGLPVYHHMRQVNLWTAHFLPHAGVRLPPPGLEVTNGTGRGWGTLRRAAEAGLRSPAGACLERWEMARKVRKFSQQVSHSAEAAFCADWCKGHFDNHGRRALEGFADRLRELELTDLHTV